MSDQTPEPDDLRALDERLRKMRRREAVKHRKPEPSPMGIAFRFATEMVSGVVVGGGMGWGLDWLFGTRPILLIVFFVLGAAAGIRNVMRAAKKLNEQAAAARAVDDDEER
jgi:ATP synthase protein I